MLVDPYGRPIKGLRISVTQRCNLKCFYCHFEGEVPSAYAKEMSPDEIETLVRVASSLGVTRIKLTGGEPTIRKDILEIITRISSVPGVEEVSMTTNGTFLSGLAGDLRAAGLNRVNISLDTLNPDIYERITGFNLLDKVIDGIKDAVNAGLYPVKINMVVMKDINDHEVWDMIAFSRDNGAILQLIELESPLGEADEVYRRFHYDLSPIEHRLEAAAEKILVREMHHRKKYVLKDGSEVEIVKPMHNSEFCKYCNRMRVTSDGKLKPCLFRNDNLVDFVGALRRGSAPKELEKIFLKAVKLRKPFFT